ncbi:MAG: hypothetical protein EPO22_05745 [Dehalococcoidia bacterium]|nr:MAG: hypothetical protein EPO22_05745 [Dehalococcoidia bacterium]
MISKNAASRSMIFSLPAGRTLRAYVAMVTAAGALAAALAATLGHGANDAGLIAGLVLAGALSERWKVGLFGDAHVSLSAAVLMAAGLAGGPRDVAIVAPLLAVAVNVGGVVPLYKTAFNAATYVLASLAFLATVNVFVPQPNAGDWMHVVPPATAGVCVYFVVNAALVAFAVVLASGERVLDVMRGRFLWLLPNYLPIGAIAAAFLLGYDSIGAWAILVFAGPAAGVQVALALFAAVKRSGEERLHEMEERMQVVERELALARRLDDESEVAHVA